MSLSFQPGAEAPHPLDNAVWWALGSRHRTLAEVHGRARRYCTDVSVFAAVDACDPGSWSDLAHLVGPAGHCALFRPDIPMDLPRGWTASIRGRARQMIVRHGALAPPEPVPLRRLTTDDVPQMVELVALTEPGPFRTGTIEMGHYYGYFEGGQLVSMAGERLACEGYTEISAVCTRPEVRGRGLASALTHHVASGIHKRGEMPFLHVAESNDSARRVYEKLGFEERRFVDVVVLNAPPLTDRAAKPAEGPDR
jgi:GNAT superfamily N-acetyltransferase